MSHFLHTVLPGVLVLAAFSSCAKKASERDKQTGKAFDPMAFELTDPGLIEGRRVWLASCAQCHVRGVGGAPIIADKHAWEARLSKGKAVLYDHAINGFSGPLMNQMPPKGGFTDLTDDEVMRAVDFILFSSQ